MVRLEEFDIMKGVAMLSVIVSHICLPEFFALYHVPLFFFVSGYFFKKKTISENLRINCNQLLVPYLKCGGGILLCYLLFYGTEYASIYSKDLILGTCVKTILLKKKI